MDLTWMPANEIAVLMAERTISPVDVVDHFLSRIKLLDSELHAFAFVDEENARKQAEEAERAIADGQRLGPLHGVPLAVTDAHMIKGLANPMWGIDRVEYEDLFVQRLREAGAIIMGLTATYHWSPRERPRNPWDLDRDPGNTSRGSAVAVATGMLPVAIGIDGGGSTRLPASWCGLIGVHPSRGLVPYMDPANPGFALTASHGPIARSARDAALVLQVMAGPDGRDFVSTEIDPPDYLARIEDGLSGLCLAWTDDYGWSRELWVEESAGILDFAKRAAFGLAEYGAHVAEVPVVLEKSIPIVATLGEIIPAVVYNPPVAAERLAQRMAAVDEAWGWTGETRDTVADYMNQSAKADTAEKFLDAINARQHNWQQLREVLAHHDVLLSMTTPMEPRTLKEWGLMGRNFGMTSYPAHTAIYNLLGFPAVTVPCGFLNGYPVGMQVASLPGREDVILRAVRAIEQAYPLGRRPAVAEQ